MGVTRPTHEAVVGAATRWLRHPFNRVAFAEFGLPWSMAIDGYAGMRADVLGLDTYKDRVYIAECKISRSDFLRGRHKFEAYRGWCDLFYVAAPEGMLTVADLPPGVGLLETRGFDPALSRAWVVRRPALKRMDQDRRRRVHLRVLTWLLAYYWAHGLHCDEKLPLPVDGVWQPMHGLDIAAAISEGQRVPGLRVDH